MIRLSSKTILGIIFTLSVLLGFSVFVLPAFTDPSVAPSAIGTFRFRFENRDF